ncbi:MAG: succinate--CoA ligase subunit beta, partial [Desulfurococcaceae archaeon]
KVLLINIFGGITRCDEVAHGIVEAYNEVKTNIPLVIRLLGTNEEEGRRILADYGFNVYSEIDDAVKKAIELVQSR